MIDTGSIKNVYAAWSLEKDERKTSASGGVASVFYRKVIENEGIAIGTRFNEQLELIFDVATTMEQASTFKGSKYVQAKLGNIYGKTKTFLEQNKNVIFIGTPCQISGLKSYLQRDYKNLITVDLVCFGTQDQKLLKEHVEKIEEDIKEKVYDIKFRGVYDNKFTLYDKDNNLIYLEDEWEDLYYKGYVKGVFQRENCYKCKYCNTNRVADITIGDFCGLGKKIPFKSSIKDGVSLILINTKRGEEFLESCKEKLFLEKRSIEEAIKGNIPLNRAPIKGKPYYKFKKAYPKYGFEKAAKKALEEKVNVKIKKIIVKVLYYFYNLAKDIREELRYFVVIKFNKFPKVKTEFETAETLVNTRKSLARVGDGEISLMQGTSLRFQEYVPELAKKLKEVLNSNEENVLIGFNDVFSYKSLRDCKKNIKKFWKQEIWEKRDIYTKLDYKKIYENACVTRVYMRYKDKTKKVKLFNLLKKIWEGQEIVFIEGEKTRLGIGNDLFENAKKIERIIGPAENAFNYYNKILEEAKKIDKNKTILIALGPTATILAYDLGKLGYRALDIGHLDIEYEWFLKQSDNKVAIEGKYVNEAKGGNIVSEIDDDMYKKQIICEIRGD